MVTLLLSLISSAVAFDQKPNKPIGECAADLPYGAPVLNNPNTTLRCTTGYAFQHDNIAKISAWSAWTLTPDESVGCYPRTDVFEADLALPKGQRAESADYSKSGYDRGHMVPDGDLSYSLQTEHESFLMSNMSPQLPNLNRGVWKYLESSERAWAWGRKHSLTIYSGNIYSIGLSKTIGENKVVVPDFLYKIVIDNVTGEALAFSFPQVERQEINLKARLTSIVAIEKATGITFPVPANVDKNAVAKDVWPADIGDVMAAKKTSCKVKK